MSNSILYADQGLTDFARYQLTTFEYGDRELYAQTRPRLIAPAVRLGEPRRAA